MADQPVYVLGAGGHASVVLSVCKELQLHVGGIYDDTEELQGCSVMNCPVIGRITDLPTNFSGPAVVAIGNNQVRKQLDVRLPQCRWVSLIHPSALIGDGVLIGAGAVIFAGAIVQSRAQIGRHVILNTAATVDHDCHVRDYAHIAPGSHLAGNVEVGKGALLGIGSCVIPGIKVGDWSVIGAGAAVVTDIPSHVVAVGVPARIKKIDK
jgi:sugar O-acyltransferase (sialic acid O-acetyltransferase NeuD family)